MTFDDLVDLEFAFQPWQGSCREIHTLSHVCRRVAGHEGDHASGTNRTTRLRWARDATLDSLAALR